MDRVKKLGYGVLFLLLVILDQVTKRWILAHVSQGPIVLNNYMTFSFTWNRGVSWGLFGGSSRFGLYCLAAVIFLIIIAFVVHIAMRVREKESIFFETFVLAGALSNFFDRLYYGAVIDFIDVSARGWHWPSFNIADSCIVIGIAGIIARGLLWSSQKK